MGWTVVHFLGGKDCKGRQEGRGYNHFQPQGTYWPKYVEAK